MPQATSYKLQAKKGFTLLETLVAISILSFALAGILSLSALGIRSSSAASNQIKAFFLANEGLEYIRNKRDSNILRGGDWFEGLGGCESGCWADVFASAQTLNPCSGGDCPKIKFNEALDRYDYGGGSAETIFTRKLSVSRISSFEAKVVSEISWLQGNGQRSFSLEERLFDLSF